MATALSLKGRGEEGLMQWGAPAVGQGWEQLVLPRCGFRAKRGAALPSLLLTLPVPLPAL